VGDGTIVFTSSLSGSEGVYAVRPDGTGLRRLLSFPTSGAQVLWNREGTEVLVLPDGTSFRPYILDWPSRRRHPIHVTGVDPSAFSDWSPDGKKLLLSGDRVVVYDVSTRRITTIQGLTWEDQYGWAGDSKAVLELGADPRVIVRKSISGATDAAVYAGDPNANFPQSTADGKWYSFDDSAGMSDRYYVVRSNGRDRQLVAADPSGVAAAWSPKGDSLTYTTSKGTGVFDPATGKRRFVAAPTNDPSNNPPSWSPDGKWILFWRFDLGYGAPSDVHLQLWAMRSDGTRAHAVTDAVTPDWGNGTETWVAATLHGTPVPRPPRVALKGSTATTDLPVIALGALGSRAAVATGFGTDIGGPKVPLGPLVSVGSDGSSSSIPVKGCHSFGAVFLTGRQIGYDCVNDAVGYGFDDAVRLGARTLVHTIGGEFTGTYLSGVATDGHAVAFGVQQSRQPAHITRNFQIRDTRIYVSDGLRARLVATVRGVATVISIDGNRIAILHGSPYAPGGQSISVVSTGGAIRDYPIHGVVGAALAGGRLVLLEDGSLITVDLVTGRRTVNRTERGLDYGSGSGLEGVRGDLVAYVVGASIHVMRLTDGREVVLDTPGATDGALAAFGNSGLFYAYNEAYAKHPGRVGFISTPALEHAISAHGRTAR